MQKEKLSLLMDGELVDEQLIEQLYGDKALQQEWHNYHIIRGAIRDSLHDVTLNLDIAQRVIEVLEQEEQAIADMLHVRKKTGKERSFWQSISHLFTPVMQASIAACTALVVMLGAQQLGQSIDDDTLPSLSTTPIGVNLAPVGYDQEDYFKGVSELRQQEKNRVRQMLQDYEQQRRIHAEP